MRKPPYVATLISPARYADSVGMQEGQMSAAQYSQRAIDFRWLADQTTDERTQRVLIELAMEYEALAAGSHVAV